MKKSVSIQTENIREFAVQNAVPIIKDPSLNFIVNFIKENNVHSILEIGSAIGYSAINFARAGDDVFVDTVEFDLERYHLAVKNIAESGLMDRITIFLGDAARFDFKNKYDLIFIDGPKAQNMKMFVKFQNNLAPGGAIITDNLSFHGMVENQSLTHNYSTIKMVRKIGRYITFLKENPEFETEFFEIGDTISVSRKNPYPVFTKYLEESEVIDFNSPEVQQVCKKFEQFKDDEIKLVEQVYNFVQNEYPHTSDCKRTELSITASDVIKNGHGICMAKSHLFAAILRNFGIPTGFCYQILCGKQKNHFYPHGFNAVYFKSLEKWIRLDARGNKKGQNARFSIEEEYLAYKPDNFKNEVDLPMYFTSPFKGMIDCMKKCADKPEFFKHLNDLSESMRAYYQVM